MSPAPPRYGPEVEEWMDLGVGSPDEDAEAYRLLDRVNRLQAGHRLTLDALEAWIAPDARPGRALVFADVGGGDGAFAERVVEWGARRGLPVRALVLDTSATALACASAPGRAADPLRADALDLPLADGAADVVHTSCFLHHLSIADARNAVAEMCRASRGLVILNDLVRSRVAAAGIRAITALLVHNRLVRHDGPLSVRKAFTPSELRSIAHAAGAGGSGGWRWRLARGFPYRMAVVGARVGAERFGAEGFGAGGARPAPEAGA